MKARFNLGRKLLVILVLVSVQVGAAIADDARIRNVLFIISDDLKASVLGCYGDPLCRTPNIDRLAREGMVFERAYCQGTVCGPSRQSFMFSRYKGKSDVNLGQHFRQHGYFSARVGKIYHMKVPGDIIAGTNGLDEPSSWTERYNSPGLEAHTPGEYACLNLNIFSTALENRQSTAMPHRMFVTVSYEGDGADQPDHKSAAKAVELLNKHQAEPFFLAVGFVRPHYPMVAPEDYFAPYPWQTIDLPQSVENDLEDIPRLGLAGTRNDQNPIGNYPDNQKRMWSGYYASVSFMDAQVGKVLDELERLGSARIDGGRFHKRPWLSSRRARILAKSQYSRRSDSSAADHLRAWHGCRTHAFDRGIGRRLSHALRVGWTADSNRGPGDESGTCSVGRPTDREERRHLVQQRDVVSHGPLAPHAIQQR